MAAAALAGRVSGARRVAIWAQPELETCVTLVAALAAGVPAVPVNPRLGTRELRHVVSDATPELVLATPGAFLPGELGALPRLDVDLLARGGTMASEPDTKSPAVN